ncbi:MAG: rhomboid family intramembrane serine protease, partial [Armatimonadota bacterium]|nr:rhomboid family intramembrane serine protease [Armatimonadota bacterium]
MPVNFWPLFLVFAAPLPVGTDRRLRHVPWMTWGLIGLNVLVFALTYSDPTVFDRWGLVPAQPDYMKLFTYLFLHVGFWHLFWNMVFLWLFGPHVEDALGKVSYAILYFGGGIAAGLLHMAITLLTASHTGSVDAAPLIGASGAISSILAPFALRFHRAQIRLFWLPGLLLPGGWARLELPVLWGLALFFLQNLANGLWSLAHPESGGTAYWAHIGGFVFGLVAAQITNLLTEGRMDYLLQDARSVAGDLQNYRIYLDHHPEDAGVRVELARALLQRREGGASDRQDAALEALSAVRLFHKQGRLPDAAQACEAARTLGLPLLLA